MDAVEKLLAIVQIKTNVIRNGDSKEVPVEEVVPGDVVFLKAGDVIPGDCLVLESKDLFVDEAALTGETYPVEKSMGTRSPETPLRQRERKGIGRLHGQGDRIRQDFRTAETEAA